MGAVMVLFRAEEIAYRGTVSAHEKDEGREDDEDVGEPEAPSA